MSQDWPMANVRCASNNQLFKKCQYVDLNALVLDVTTFDDGESVILLRVICYSKKGST
jgi:hypothetical protein